MEIRDFGRLSDGRRAARYILRNRNGCAAAVTDYGAALTDLLVRDNKGELRDVVLGYDDAPGYEEGGFSIGGIIGRFANRIGDARFTAGGREYRLTANDGKNTLHGGRDFFNKRIWTARIPFSEVRSGDIYGTYARESLNDWHGSTNTALECRSVVFSLDSPDGDQGFPGAIHIEVKYTLTDEDELRIDYSAKPACPAGKEDGTGAGFAATLLNLTNHSYFNLDGHVSTGEGCCQSVGTVDEHLCRINADYFIPTDAASIPLDEIRETAGTAFDFREWKPVGRDIGADDVQIRKAGGYDHNFILRPWPDCGGAQCELREAARLRSEKSGIEMAVLTDLPGMQLYTANHFGREKGKGGAVYGKLSGICFETQFWPDSVNREDYPGGWLEAGEEFRSTTVFRFSSQSLGRGY